MPRIERVSVCCQPQGLASGAFEVPGAVTVLFVVGRDAFGEGISMDTEHYGRLRKVLSVFGERLLYIELFKLPDRFVEEDMAF